MDNKAKNGLNGLDTSSSSCSRNVKMRPAVGSYMDHAKGVSRPKNPKSAHLSGRHSKTIVLLIMFAAAIVIVSGVALAPVGKEKTSQPADSSAAPGPPYPVAGYTYDALGAILPSCELNITDLDTGEYNNTIVSGLNGYYAVNLGSFAAWNDGDIIKVTAVNGALVGENQSAVAGSYLRLDVTLDVPIPEFPMVIVPVMGMMALVAVMSLRRRGEEQ